MTRIASSDASDEVFAIAASTALLHFQAPFSISLSSATCAPVFAAAPILASISPLSIASFSIFRRYLSFFSSALQHHWNRAKDGECTSPCEPELAGCKTDSRDTNDGYHGFGRDISGDFQCRCHKTQGHRFLEPSRVVVGRRWGRRRRRGTRCRRRLLRRRPRRCCEAQISNCLYTRNWCCPLYRETKDNKNNKNSPNRLRNHQHECSFAQ
ncbi:hypothetical protein KCU91_g75, partial [Aureobasidium melanogenum]